MAYTAEKTWVAGAALPAAELNTYIRDNFAAIMEAASIGTSLPGAPVNGQLFAYIADASARLVWLLKYNSGGPAGKQWEFLGGSPLEAIVTTTEAMPASTSYIGFTTVVQVAVPLGGEYFARFGASFVYAVASGYVIYLSPKFGAAATSDSDAARTQIPGVNGSISAAGETGIKTLTAGDVVALQVRQAAANADQATNKTLRLYPRRVG